MKKLIRLAAVLAVVAAIAWLIRDRLVPAPEPLDEAPPFRPPPPPPPPPAAPQPVAAQPAAATAGDDLTVISGIGPTMAERLAALGVTTFAALAQADAAALAAGVAGAGQNQVEGWIAQARERA